MGRTVSRGYCLNQPTVVANVTEHFVVAKLTQGDLSPVAVSSEVLERMEALSKKPVSFPKLGPIATPRVAIFLDALAERATDKRGGGTPTTVWPCSSIQEDINPCAITKNVPRTFMPVRESISNSRESTGGRSCTQREQMAD